MNLITISFPELPGSAAEAQDRVRRADVLEERRRHDGRRDQRPHDDAGMRRSSRRHQEFRVRPRDPSHVGPVCAQTVLKPIF